MEGDLLNLADQIIDQLHKLEHDPDSDEERRDSSGFWREQLRRLTEAVRRPEVSVVFIGKVGVGKSSIVSNMSKLFVGEQPDSRSSLAERLVLATGSGRTTVCEVVITKAGESEPPLGLHLEPMPTDELEREIRIYATDEWRRRRQEGRSADEDGTATSQEIQRAIRGLTGYQERIEEWRDGNLRRRKLVRPIEAEITNFSTEEEFCEHLLKRAHLADRTRTIWSWSEINDADLRELKKQFLDLNNGEISDALLPIRLTISVRSDFNGLGDETSVKLIDTRGLDGRPAARPDLLRYLKDPNALYILCSSFNSAPDEEVRELLSMQRDSADLNKSLERTMILIVDQEQAVGTNGAEGDRDIGQEIKVEECWQSIEKLVSEVEFRERIVAYDLLRDHKERFLHPLQEVLNQHLARQIQNLKEGVEHAGAFLTNERSGDCPQLRIEIDSNLKEALRTAVPSGSPTDNPMMGILNALETANHVSKVFATCRRFGEYRHLDVYTALSNFLSANTSRWLQNLITVYRQALDKFRNDSKFVVVRDYIELRQLQLEKGYHDFIGDYVQRVSDELHPRLRDDTVWNRCVAEWGQGAGFKNRIVEHLRIWYEQQRGQFREYETIDVGKFIPLVAEVARPVEAPRFTLHVKNLRILRNAEWTPEPVSLLIGPNGAGKSSLLLALRLLRVAYDKGLPEAVRVVMGGSHNLKTWGVADDEPIELGLSIGDVRWHVQLIPSIGSADYQTEELLTHHNREVFKRDVLGNFMFNGDRLPPTQLLGLRALIDRGVFEQSVRTVALFMQSIQVFHDPDLWNLRLQGSMATDDRQLHSRGANVLAVLRRWFQERDQRYRFDFVIEGLRAAFPACVQDLDFQQADNTLVTRVYRPGSDSPSPLSSEANGVLHLLIYLTELAGAEKGSLIAFDEPENGLHPYALEELLRRTQRWARKYQLTVLLATHSLVLLNRLTGHPEQIFIATRTPNKQSSFPVNLPAFADLNWLMNFQFGDLYERGELGSNEDSGV